MTTTTSVYPTLFLSSSYTNFGSALAACGSTG